MMIPRQALRSLAPAAVLFASSRISSSRFFVSARPFRVSAARSAACAFQPPTIPSETAEAIKGLEPPAVWSHFASLSSIPRPSGKEEAVLSYVKGYADSEGLKWKEDAAGNLCVFRPGSGGGEGAPPVIIQGHVDMVTEKNKDTNHNFDTDPILLKRLVESDDGKTWLGARGTTLGADNGLGVAAALTILGTEGSKPLPPIEALFTVEEETGLHGAAKIDSKALGLTGSTMLNLDMEEWGDLFVGCAGGGDSTITIPLQRETLSSSLSDVMEIRVEGLMGGHSGLNIHEGRANAVILCAAAAQSALQAAQSNAALLSICGGDKHNAIPREASAILAVAPSARDAVEASVRASAVAAGDEFGLLEKGLSLQLKEANGIETDEPLDETSTSRLLSALLALPHGPIKYSHALPGLVETSNNLASVSTRSSSDVATILCSSRSSIGTALENTRDRIKAIAFLAGGSVEQSEAYPGWNPNPTSEILDVSKRLLAEKIDHKPGVNAVHAGLECGLLIEKLGGNVDVISFGPTITGAHSPDERVDATTVAPFFELVEDILAEYAGYKYNK